MNTPEKRWVCTICGYVHQGTELPDCCPICGATPDLFELQPQVSLPSDQDAFTQWACLNCEYIHYGSDPPENCPVCGLPAAQFEPHRDSPVVAVSEQGLISIVIVGAGIAGVSAAETIRQDSPAAVITFLIDKKVSCTDLLHTHPGVQEIITYVENHARQQV